VLISAESSRSLLRYFDCYTHELGLIVVVMKVTMHMIMIMMMIVVVG
jgi:hypothetical protein